MSQHPQRSASPTRAHPLERLLWQLQSMDDTWLDHPELLIVHGPTDLVTAPEIETRSGSSERSVIEIRPLLGIDPVAEMIGIEPAESWQFVGVRAAAVSRRLFDGQAPQKNPTDANEAPCAFIHLIDRQGTSLTELSVAGSESIRLGPDRILREGRIADACRRVFALPTAPAPDMAEFVIDAWLTLVLRSALVTPGLDWSDVVRLSLVHHLSTTRSSSAISASMSPAELARALHDSAASLNWTRYRDACIALGGCPVSDLTPNEINWMDTGMFARWAHSALPRACELLELLEPTLDPVAHDRLWATVSLTERLRS